MRRIHHDGAELITPAGERGPDSCKVLAFMRGEGAANIFRGVRSCAVVDLLWPGPSSTSRKARTSPTGHP